MSATSFGSTDGSSPAELLRRLVEIPSLSGSEAAASRFLADQMDALGYDRSYVDEAGNAVGERGPRSAAKVLVLLGHIDTVPGEIPVRYEETGGGLVLHGRGTVDAKGPLVTFVSAAARIPRGRLERAGVRLVVVGAVEEEAATSKGARFVRARFDGSGEPVPEACVIGEPSRFHRVTLGYKGRVLLDVRAERELTHTAGPDPGIGVQVVDFWNLLAAEAERFNVGRDKPFSQLQPSLRALRSGLQDGLISWAEGSFGVRLPLDFDVQEMLESLVEGWSRQAAAREECEGAAPALPRLGEGGSSLAWQVGQRRLELLARGFEPAWKSERSSSLVRAFQRAIRTGGERPGFVVKTGTSDMNVVAPAWRCPIVAYGPGDSALDHTPHEHLPVLELERAVDVLEHAIGAWLESL